MRYGYAIKLNHYSELRKMGTERNLNLERDIEKASTDNKTSLAGNSTCCL